MSNLGHTFLLTLALVFLSAHPLQAEGSNPDELFSAAHAHFLEGRNRQKLHRNTDASRSELTAAFEGYRAAADADPDGALAPRALYMSASAKLFLDQPEDAVAIYEKVVEEHPGDRYYLAKSLVKKASVEKSLLKPEAARLTLSRYRDEFPDQGPNDLRGEVKRMESALAVIGKSAPPVAAARWFNSPAGVENEGQVVLVYFWASWCPNCQKEVAFINDLWQRYRDRGLRVIGVTNHSRGQTDATVEEYIKKNDFTFPIAVDAGGQTSRTLNGGSVPSAVLIDRSGRVRWHDHPAALSDSAIDRLLAPANGDGA